MGQLWGVPQSNQPQQMTLEDGTTFGMYSPEYTANMDEDLEIILNIGLFIDYVDGKLGNGLFGAVYRGYFTIDANGNELPEVEFFENVEPNRRFAVKIVDFGETDTYTDRINREMYETEKYVLTEVMHKNIVTIKMIINMGQQRLYPFKENPQFQYLSSDRQYLFMDLADEGELESFLFKYRDSIEPSLRINLIRDLFFGLLYLHQNSIIHGDIHSKNVLIFTENGQKVAKWSDFGLSYVGSERPNRLKKPQSLEVSETFHASYMRTETRFDIQGMLEIFRNILENRHLCPPETSEETSLLDDCQRMIDESKNNFYTLLEMCNNFRHILWDQLFFN